MSFLSCSTKCGADHSSVCCSTLYHELQEIQHNHSWLPETEPVSHVIHWMNSQNASERILNQSMTYCKLHYHNFFKISNRLHTVPPRIQYILSLFVYNNWPIEAYSHMSLFNVISEEQMHFLFFFFIFYSEKFLVGPKIVFTSLGDSSMKRFGNLWDVFYISSHQVISRVHMN